MAKLLKLRRGTTSQHSSFTGAEGEVTIDTNKDVPVVHDGSTAGGHPVAAEDMANVSSANILGRISNGDIVGTKLENSGVTAGAYGSSSAIPIVTVDAQGLVTAASTTAIDSTTIANGTSNVAVANNGDITTTRSGTARLVVDDAGVDVTGTLNVTQNGGFTGGVSAASLTLSNNNLIINGTQPQISFVDSDGNPDYLVKVQGGIFDIRDNTADASRFSISSTGETSSEGKLNCQAGLDTDGDVVFNSDTTNVNITLDASTSTMNFSDSMALSFGDHSTTGDYQISYVNGGDFTILAMAGGSEDLIIGRYENAAVKKHIVSTRAGVAELYYDNTKHLETQSGGIGITGGLNVSGNTALPDSSKFIAGTGDDLQIYHDGSNSYIGNGTGDIILENSGGNTSNQLRFRAKTGEESIVAHGNGAVELYYDNSKKLETISAGVSVTGNIAVSGTVDGRDVAADGTKLDGIESGATADQTGAEIASALGAQNIYTTGNIGRDSGDYLTFADNSYLGVYINGNNEFKFEADGDFHADGDVIAYSTSVASDENLKKDITTVTDAVTKAEALKGVTFTWKKDDKKSAGVIAQDVEKVLPEAVRTISDFDGNEFKAVNYGAITSILIEAVKELSAKVKVLEAK